MLASILHPKHPLQLGSDSPVPEEQSWDVILVVYILMCPGLPERQPNWVTNLCDSLG